MSLAHPKPNLAILRDRAACFRKVREFFADRNVLEVDCFALSQSASIDAHIDLIPALYHQKETRYLFTSPEYGMKRLLSEGIGDIYQMSHVFRDGERGRLHVPEFTLIEWYRLNFSFQEMMEETADLVALLIGERPREILSYREALLRYVGLDPFTSSIAQWQELVHSNETDRDELLNLALGSLLEPELGRGKITVLKHYPATQAALAKKEWVDGVEVAERFEIYVEGMELANGYHELTDAKEQRERFFRSNQQRQALGKAALPLDEHFLKALEKGMPECCGVAVGFDRLMMLRHQVTHIDEVVAFSWEQV